MALIPNLSDIPELSAVASGEYDLQVVSAKEQKYDSGSKCLLLTINIIGEENAEPFWHKLWLPTSQDDETKTVNKWRTIKSFLKAVGLPEDGELEAEDFQDLQFSALLDQEPNYQDENKMDNVIVRIT